MTVRDAGSLLRMRLDETIEALGLGPRDAAAVRLAREYAGTIDQACGNPDVLDKLGPKLLTVLEALGATPAARARIREGGQQADAAPSRLAQLREASARSRRA